MKIVIASDSFKGTLSSSEIAKILSDEFIKRDKNVEIAVVPIADGGEGLLSCFEKILGGKRIKERVMGPNFKLIDAEYLLAGDTAVVEMAEAAGLPLADPKSAKDTTTFGVGELIMSAEKNGAKEILLGLGGSATNDMGCGMAAALRTVFYDKKGRTFVPVGATLKDVEYIEFGKTHALTALCDVKNPLFGENGAAYVYGPQKGATPDDVKMLDDGLRHIADVLTKSGKTDFNVEGAGAAGGLGAGVIAFADGKLKRGIDAVLDAVKFDKLIENADFVITGEGSLDGQSFSGKVIDGIISRCKKTPVIAVVGISKIANASEYGLSKVFQTEVYRGGDDIVQSARRCLVSTAVDVADYIFN